MQVFISYGENALKIEINEFSIVSMFSKKKKNHLGYRKWLIISVLIANTKDSLGEKGAIHNCYTSWETLMTYREI